MSLKCSGVIEIWKKKQLLLDLVRIWDTLQIIQQYDACEYNTMQYKRYNMIGEYSRNIAIEHVNLQSVLLRLMIPLSVHIFSYNVPMMLWQKYPPYFKFGYLIYHKEEKSKLDVTHMKPNWNCFMIVRSESVEFWKVIIDVIVV